MLQGVIDVDTVLGMLKMFRDTPTLRLARHVLRKRWPIYALVLLECDKVYAAFSDPEPQTLGVVIAHVTGFLTGLFDKAPGARVRHGRVVEWDSCKVVYHELSVDKSSYRRYFYHSTFCANRSLHHVLVAAEPLEKDVHRAEYHV